MSVINQSVSLYPEKPRQKKTFLDQLHKGCYKPLLWFNVTNIRPYQAFVVKVNQRHPFYQSLSDEYLSQHLTQLRTMLSMQGLQEDVLVDVFALIKHVCERVLKISPYHTQLMAARMMLDGKLVEMATGEGKTLTAGIALAAAAMAGLPVHLLTSNDYLAARDAKQLAPLYAALGLTVGIVVEASKEEERRAAYACHICYCTAKELVFDYLRDQALMRDIQSDLHMRVAQVSGNAPKPVLRGLQFALVDEIDSILIDEARVPLILSKSALEQTQLGYYLKALALAKSLHIDTDYVLNPTMLTATLTPHGFNKIEQEAKKIGGVWNHQLYSTTLIQTALSALHLYHPNQQYLITKQGIKVIDPLTGRVAEGRIWSNGLHQLIELKEGLKPTGDTETIAQMTYQRFFPKFYLLGGMSGTVNEVRTELYETYGLKMLKVPLYKPSQRVLYPTRLFNKQADLFTHLIQQVKKIHATGRPILIGTDSVADSEEISQLLKLHQLNHQVLNARQNALEAALVAEAGKSNKITVSTNMAGRGTDIHILSEIAVLGGLHVISCQHNDSKRMDRQLVGRAARQGDPGSAELLINIDKLLIYNSFNKFFMWLIPSAGITQPQWFVRGLIHVQQWLSEYHSRSQRQATFQQDIAIEEENLSVETAY